MKAEQSSNLKPPESYTIRHIETKPGNSLKASDDPIIGGRSRYFLKDIFTNLKGIMLGNSQNHINIKVQKSEGTAKSFKGVTNSHVSEKGIAETVTVESFSSKSINPSISDALPMETSTKESIDGMKLSEPDGNKDLAKAVLSRHRVADRDHHQLDTEQLSFSTELLTSINSCSAEEIFRNNLTHKEIISKEKSFVGPELDHRPTLSAGTNKHIGLAEIFMRPMNSETDKEETGKLGSVLTSTLENSNEKGGEDVVRSVEITSLISCLKDLPHERSIKSDDIRSDKARKAALSMKPSLTDHRTKNNIRKSNTGKRKQVSCMADKNRMNEDENRRKSIGEALSPQVPLEMSKEEPIEHPKIADEDMTGEGAENAFDRTDVLVEGADVIVEATSAMKNVLDKVSIPGLIGYPGVPLALVKNPICTVMVQNLTQDISSRHLRETLAICGGEISGIFFGPSNSDAFVEFKTEVAKERAIAKHSINVLGEWLTIRRIDVPRTTVVRISNINQKSMGKVHNICHRCGMVKFVTQRSKGIADIHYNFTEWPNMLKILNDLNGRKEDGKQWVVQPAPVFPPEILRVLWSQPDEKRRLKDIMCSYLHELGEKPLSTAGLTDLVATFCSDRI